MPASSSAAAPDAPSAPRLRPLLLGLILGGLALAGALVFVHPAEIADGFRRVGAGFFAILALSGARFLLRTFAWQLCVPDGHRLPFGQALRAVLAGDALGNLTPLGLFASEPAKVWLARHHLDAEAAVAALVLENALYTASVALVLGIGASLLVATLPALARFAPLVGVAALLALAVIAAWWLRGRSTAAGSPAGPNPAAGGWRATLGRVGAAIRARLRDRPSRILAVVGFHGGFHALAIAEVYVTLRAAYPDQSLGWVQAFLLEAVNRFTTIAFKFVPLRVGVDEAGSGLLASAVALGAVAGVTLAVVRKARTLFWILVGLGCFAWDLRGRRDG